MTRRLIENCGLDDKVIKIIFIKSFFGGLNLLSLAKQIKHDYKYKTTMDEMILNVRELERVIGFGCALEEFGKKFMVGETEAWETLELFLEDPEKHLKGLYKYGSTSFKELVKKSIKNKENFLNHYWSVKKEIIEGFYSPTDEDLRITKPNKKDLEIFDEPDYVLEYDY